MGITTIPGPGTPFTLVGKDGNQYINPVWHRYLANFSLRALTDLETNGIVANSGGNLVGRTITPGSSKISVTNGDGILGDPTIDAVEANIDHDALLGFVANEHLAPAAIDHNILLNYVANEHINHTSVTFSAGTGLTGGGNIAANRSFALAAGTTVQTVSTTSSSKAVSTTEMDWDETIPQKNEGDEYFTLAITPTAATNILVIDIFIPTIDVDTAGAYFTGALFQDNTNDALQASSVFIANPDETHQFTLRYRMAAGTTSATTFKFRFGADSTNLAYCNRGSSASTDDLFSTASVATFTIQEIIV